MKFFLIGENPAITEIIKYILTAVKLDWAVAAPDERSLHKYNISSYFLDDWYHNTFTMEGSTTYSLPYWMGVYHGITK